MPTKFEQRNSAAGKMTGSQVAMGVATGRMSAKDVANAMGKPAKSAATATKSNATKTTGSYKKPTTPPAKSTVKTQNIPEVTVSVTKKTTGAKPVPTTPAKEKGSTNKYVQRTAGGEYIELTAEESSKAPKGSNVQTLTESQYKGSKNRILPVGSKVVMMGGQETVLNASQYANYMSKRKNK